MREGPRGGCTSPVLEILCQQFKMDSAPVCCCCCCWHSRRPIRACTQRILLLLLLFLSHLDLYQVILEWNEIPISPTWHLLHYNEPSTAQPSLGSLFFFLTILIFMMLQAFIVSFRPLPCTVQLFFLTTIKKYKNKFHFTIEKDFLRVLTPFVQRETWVEEKEKKKE